MDEAVGLELGALLDSLVLERTSVKRTHLLDQILLHAAELARPGAGEQVRRLVWAMWNESVPSGEPNVELKWAHAAAYRDLLQPVRAAAAPTLRALLDAWPVHPGAKLLALELLDPILLPEDAVRLGSLAAAGEEAALVRASATLLWHRLEPGRALAAAARLLRELDELSADRVLPVLAQLGADLVEPAVAVATTPGVSHFTDLCVLRLLNQIGPSAFVVLERIAACDDSASRGVYALALLGHRSDEAVARVFRAREAQSRGISPAADLAAPARGLSAAPEVSDD